MPDETASASASNVDAELIASCASVLKTGAEYGVACELDEDHPDLNRLHEEWREGSAGVSSIPAKTMAGVKAKTSVLALWLLTRLSKKTALRTLSPPTFSHFQVTAMVEAKTAPRISLIQENRLERAFRDLEGSVSDLKSMSIIMESVVEHTIRGDRRDDESEDMVVRLSRDEFNTIHFAIMLMGDMIRKFHDVYYESLEGPAS
jgi:hypothetical protein